MELDRKSDDRRDEDGRRLTIDRRQELIAVDTDMRVNLDRRSPYIRRLSFDRRSIDPAAS